MPMPMIFLFNLNRKTIKKKWLMKFIDLWKVKNLIDFILVLLLEIDKKSFQNLMQNCEIAWVNELFKGFVYKKKKSIKLIE